MKTSGKTPYEIRLELLQLSFEILRNKQPLADSSKLDKEVLSPTTEEVIAEAEKLNTFVSKAITH